MTEPGLHLGTLRLGSTETFALACLPAFMRAISSRYSGLQLECIVRTSAELEQGVRERRLDIAFAINPIGDPKLTLVLQPATWAATPSFNLTAPLHPSHLRGLTVITNPHPAPMWRQITDWFRQAGCEPSRICRCSSPTVVTRLVTEGLGVSLLPQVLVQDAIDAGRVCALKTELPLHPSRMFAVYRVAEGSRFIQDVIGLGSAVMTSTKLVDGSPSA